MKFNVPKSTLHDHLSGTSSKRYGGPPTVLTANEEKEIVRTCLVMHEFGFPLDKDLVSRAVRDFLVAQNRSGMFTNGLPGRMWWVDSLDGTLNWLRESLNIFREIEHKLPHLK